jgi:hypothetical protein
MNKRPKSREETPKEGSDSARRYRTATICDRAAQSARPFEIFPVQNSQACPAGNKTNGQNSKAISTNYRDCRPCRDELVAVRITLSNS